MKDTKLTFVSIQPLRKDKNISPYVKFHGSNFGQDNFDPARGIL
jgi:hypothetical protein